MLEVLRHFLDSGFLAKAGMRESDRQLLRDNMRDHNAFRAGEKTPSWRSALMKSGLMVFQLIEDGDWGGGGVTRVWNGSLWAGRLWVLAAGVGWRVIIHIRSRMMPLMIIDADDEHY